MSAVSWWGPLALTIAGGVIYHVSAKSLPKELNPALILVVAYATALCGSPAAYVMLPADRAAPAASRVLNPAVIFTVAVDQRDTRDEKRWWTRRRLLTS
jgi:hypothetical protein